MHGSRSKPRGGRKRGTPNKATAGIKALARTYTAEAIKRLATLMRKGKSEAGIVAACREIIDRRHTKANQPISGPNDGPLVVEIVRFANQKPKDWQPREYQLPAWRYLQGGGKRADLCWHPVGKVVSTLLERSGAKDRVPVFYALAVGSARKGAASDGSDMCADITEAGVQAT